MAVPDNAVVGALTASTVTSAYGATTAMDCGTPVLLARVSGSSTAEPASLRTMTFSAPSKFSGSVRSAWAVYEAPAASGPA